MKADPTKAQVMIAMQMADKNMIDPAGLNIETQHLLLGAFAAVNQIQALIDIKRLRCWVSIKNGGCRTAAKYR